MVKRKFLVVLLFFCVLNLSAQYVSKYRSPVSFSITLAGNVGEVRSNHFHSGIDIKALRGVGSPVYSIADGYVSRVGIAPNGYGNFVMITHKDGISSLYAHLEDFTGQIRKYITSEQLKNKRYAIDLYFASDKFPVKSGDVIGTLGNSGASGGPHLHFEVRDQNSNAINSISRGLYHVADHLAPICTKLFVYQCDTIKGLPIFSLSQVINFERNKFGDYVPSTRDITIDKNSYLAYEVIDYKDGRTNTMGVFGLKQEIDGNVNFEFEIDKISFATTRYINSFVQFDQNRSSKYHVVRAYVSPNNKLDIYQRLLNRGVIKPPSVGEQKTLTTTITDDQKNEIQLKFNIVRGSSKNGFQIADNEQVIAWDMDHFLSKDNLSVNIPFGALYDNQVFSLGVVGDTYIIGNEGIALHKNIKIRVSTNLAQSLQRYAYLARVKPNGELAYMGGKYQNGSIEVSSRVLGKIVVAYDSIVPTIKPQLAPGSILKSSEIRFTIGDNLSGVKRYDIFIDGNWVVGEYDYRNGLLRTKVILSQTPKDHILNVVVTDGQGNTNKIQTKYKW